MKCPGQDGRYWKPEDVFELPCPECGDPVEFFKDDFWRECPACGRLVRNSSLDLGCAEWCPSAEKCLHDGPGSGRDDVSAEGGRARISRSRLRRLRNLDSVEDGD